MTKRNTSQKRAVRAVFDEAAGPLSAQEVLNAARAGAPRIGIATVYRNLGDLVEEGWLALVELAGEPGRYERADQDHHHHFRCEACGRVFDMPGCVVTLGAGLPEGFQVRRHEVVLSGTCPDC